MWRLSLLGDSGASLKTQFSWLKEGLEEDSQILFAAPKKTCLEAVFRSTVK